MCHPKLSLSRVSTLQIRMRFLHCVAFRQYLNWSIYFYENDRNYYESSTQCKKRKRKWDVATQLKSTNSISRITAVYIDSKKLTKYVLTFLSSVYFVKACFNLVWSKVSSSKMHKRNIAMTPYVLKRFTSYDDDIINFIYWHGSTVMH